MGLVISVSFIVLVTTSSKEREALINVEKNTTFTPFLISNNEVTLDSNFYDEYTNNSFTDYDTTTYVLNISDSSELKVPFVVDEVEKKIYKKVYSGNRINIVITGVDSRIGERYKHADANHIISIIPDKNSIEIFSIPRDTYADAGFEEDSLDKFNLLTNVLGRRGRSAYLVEVAKIAEIDKIHYFIEIGFSQAIGLIEKLGFKNPSVTLQMLRDRKSYRTGDYQRTYNQGKFIRKSILKSKELFFTNNDLILNFFLNIVSTNLKIDDIKDIIAQIDLANLTESMIVNELKPKIITSYEEIDLFNSAQYDSLIAKNEINVFESKSEYVAGKLLEILDDAEFKNSSQIKVNKLKRYFEQKAWLQISDLRIRNAIKSRFKDILSQAYTDLGKFKDAQKVINIDYN